MHTGACWPTREIYREAPLASVRIRVVTPETDRRQECKECKYLEMSDVRSSDGKRLLQARLVDFDTNSGKLLMEDWWLVGKTGKMGFVLTDNKILLSEEGCHRQEFNTYFYVEQGW